MIGKLLSTLVVLAIGAAAMWFALAHHIVTTDDGRLYLSKAELGFTDTLVDITDWTAEDFNEHRNVTTALVDNGHADLVVKSATDSFIDKAKDFFGGSDKDKDEQ